MRIIQVIQKPQLRGAEIFASQLSNHLMEEGHEVIVICVMAGAAKLPFKGKMIYLNRPVSKRFLDVSGWRQLANLIGEVKPDLLQVNAGDTLKFAVGSKLFFRWTAPIIFRNANKVSDFINSAIKKQFNKFLIRQVAHVISVSELCRLDFLKTYDLTDSRVTTVPIGIELVKQDTTIPKDLQSWMSEGNVLVNVASLVPEKNHIGLLRTIKRMADEGHPVKLMIVGDGKLKGELLRQVAELQLTNQVLLTGYRTDVLAIVANAQAFVIPSLIEGLPGVILEAMYCRTPVVAYDVGGIPEVVKRGKTGYLVKAGDESAFADAICAALEGRNEFMIDQAYQQVMTQFDNRTIAQRFLAVYQQVVNPAD